MADEGGRARHAGEGSSLGVSVVTISPGASLLQASQKDSNFRLEEKLRDTNNWRGELQAEMDAVTQETEQLLETRSSCRHSCSAAANSCLLPQVPAAGQHRADPAPAARHHGVPDGAGGAARGGQGAGPGEYWPLIGQQQEQHSSLIGQVEVSLEKEVDTVRSQQGKMRDLLVTVSIYSVPISLAP